MEFNANIARQLAEEATAMDGPRGRAETEVCLTQIRQAAEKGERACTMTIAYNYRDLITKRLELAGFVVKHCYEQRDGDYSRVSW